MTSLEKLFSLFLLLEKNDMYWEMAGMAG